jgi:hypothetical protein
MNVIRLHCEMREAEFERARGLKTLRRHSMATKKKAAKKKKKK